MNDPICFLLAPFGENRKNAHRPISKIGTRITSAPIIRFYGLYLYNRMSTDVDLRPPPRAREIGVTQRSSISGVRPMRHSIVAARVTLAAVALFAGGCETKNTNTIISATPDLVIIGHPAAAAPTAQEHCEQYGKSAVLDSVAMTGLDVSSLTFRCE